MFELVSYKSLNSVIPKAKMEELLKVNEQSRYYNLQLTEKDIKEIVQERNDALVSTDRVEFGFNTMEYLINTFYKSPYINQTDYVETLCELQSLFYSVRNELDNTFYDEEIIDIMKTLFDGTFNGSLELLKGVGAGVIAEMSAAAAQNKAEDDRWE